jgi:hypothetical protein
MPNEFVARNGVIALNNSTVTGSLNVTNGITGSLFGTASFATTASFALNAGGAAAASNLIFSGSVTASVDVAGTTFRLISGSSTFLFVSRSGDIGIGTIIPAAKLQVSGTVNVVNFRGSGSLTTSSIFTVDGAAGRLFSVNDSLSGSLFSVNTIAGLPVIEAFSDNTVRIGQFGQRALFVSQSRVGINKETALNANLDISGSVIITGSLIIISGSSREFQVTNIGVNIGNIVTDTHTLTGSFNVSGSIISNGNTIVTGSFTVISGSSTELQVTNIGVNIGNIVTDIHTLTGSVSVSGSITGSRINPRTFTTASTSTFTPNVNIGDTFTITAQTSSLILANPTGSPVEGQKIIIRIKDNGTARALTTGSQYRASTDLAFPLSSSINKTLYLGLIYNSTDIKWDLIAVLNNF